MLESKTVKTASGTTVLNSDEVLRNDVEALKVNVVQLINDIKKQRMSVSLDTKKLAEFVTDNMESSTQLILKDSLDKVIDESEKQLIYLRKDVKEHSSTIKKEMNEVRENLGYLIEWSKPVLTTTAVIFGMLLATVVFFGFFDDLVHDLLNLVYLREAMSNAIEKFFHTSGWGYLGWGLTLLVFIFIEVGVVVFFVYCLFRVIQFSVDRFRSY